MNTDGLDGTTTDDSSSGTLGWFIDQVLLDDLRRMVFEHRLYYLSFGVMASAIEFMGACLDTEDFNQRGRSERRFRLAIAELFDARYRRFADDLYLSLRNGMAHVMRPQSSVAFTNRADGIKEGVSHLEETSSGKLVLIAEDLYEDFACAAEVLKRQMASNAYPKKKRLADHYLTISERDAAP